MRLETDRIAHLLSELEIADPKFRLHMLRQAVMQNGGRWDLPSEKPGVYEPAIKEIMVYGLFAAAENIEELPRNWMRAAMNILKATESEGEAA